MTPRRLRLGAALVALVVAVVAAIQLAGGSDAGPRPVVLAASSLTEVLPRVDPDGRYSLGGSNQLARQIEQGAPFDVFLSASPRYTRALHATGRVAAPVAFATNALVLVVPRANPAGIETVGELARSPGLRLVAAGPGVPIGAYTREVLGRLGLERVLDDVVSLEPDVKGILGKVALGEADAGFVYASDARAAATDVRVIRFPASAQPEVRYEAAVAAEPRSAEAARAFVAALQGPEGRAALRAAGFGVP